MGGGGAAGFAGVDSLVALGVAGEVADVGREGHGAGGGGVDGAVEGDRGGVLLAATDGRGERAVARFEPKLASGRRGAARTDEGGPGAVVVFAQQEEFHAPPVPARTPRRRAAMTRVSFRTRRSPGRRRAGRSRTC